MRKWPPLYLRILVVIGLALIIAAAVANYYGAKTEAYHEGSIEVGEAQGVAVFVMSLAGEGDAVIALQGVSSAFYISNVSGDVMSLVSSLSVFNISVEESNTVHDVRAGIFYGFSTLKANRYLLNALPTVAKMLNFGINSIPAENNSVSVDMHLFPSESAIVIGVPTGDVVKYSIDYRLSGYERLGFRDALILGGLLMVSGLFGSLLWLRNHRYQ